MGDLKKLKSAAEGFTILDLIKKTGAYFSTFSYSSQDNNQLNLASYFYLIHDAN